MGWLLAILQFLVNLLKLLRGGNSSERAEKDYLKRHTEWENDLRACEGAEQVAHEAWLRGITAHRSDPDRLLQLHESWSQAAVALRRCREREPARPANRAK